MAKTAFGLLRARGYMPLAARLAAAEGTTVRGLLAAKTAPGKRSRLGLWLTLSECHGLSTTEIGQLTGRDQSTVSEALTRAWAYASSSDPARQRAEAA